MSFMAVAYVPAFLEDRATFIKERSNGLYGATAFMMANFLIGLPYLCLFILSFISYSQYLSSITHTKPVLISLIFSIIAYWLSNFRPGADAFFTWVMWLFLDLLAGESLVVLVSSLFPNFVVALALTAFANGLWMSVGGFLVSPTILNPFWRYVFHYIDYVSPVIFLHVRIHHPDSNFISYPNPLKRSNQILTYMALTASLCLSRNDGQRIWLPQLRLRFWLSVYVPDLARARVHDRRPRRTGPVRLPHRGRGQVGWDHAWDSDGVQIARVGRELFKKVIIESKRKGV